MSDTSDTSNTSKPQQPRQPQLTYQDLFAFIETSTRIRRLLVSHTKNKFLFALDLDDVTTSTETERVLSSIIDTEDDRVVLTRLLTRLFSLTDKVKESKI